MESSSRVGSCGSAVLTTGGPGSHRARHEQHPRAIVPTGHQSADHPRRPRRSPPAPRRRRRPPRRDHADAHVERAVQLVGRQAPVASSRTRRNSGGTGHEPSSMPASTPGGSTRGRFSGRPPPVMWASALTPPVASAGGEHGEVVAVRCEQGVAERPVERRLGVDVHRHPREQLAQQRVAVGVRPRSTRGRRGRRRRRHRRGGAASRARPRRRACRRCRTRPACRRPASPPSRRRAARTRPPRTPPPSRRPPRRPCRRRGGSRRCSRGRTTAGPPAPARRRCSG